MKTEQAARKRSRAHTLALEETNHRVLDGKAICDEIVSQPTVCSSSTGSSSDKNLSTCFNNLSMKVPNFAAQFKQDFHVETDTASVVSYKDALLQRLSNLPQGWSVSSNIDEDKASTASATTTTSSPPSPMELLTLDNQQHDEVDVESIQGQSQMKSFPSARIHSSVIRGAIAHAASQGVLSKSSKREMRQSMLRGQTHMILEGLRQKCHLQPLVSPAPQPPATDFELRHTNGLVKCLHMLAPLQDTETLTNKHIVLLELDRVLESWMRSLRPGRPHHASLYVGGSWYLKVDGPESDLDIVILCPNFVSSADFFTHFRSHLTNTKDVSDVVCMEEAYVPTISCAFHNVRLDLLFARYTQSHVPKHLPIHSDHILSGMDSNSVRSLSVPRTASLILELVPNPTTFRTCLRVIRLWAKRRGLYSNKVGYLGGISWTVLVAFVCQMFPNAVAASLVHHFFAVLSSWRWPTPIFLAKPYDAGHGFAQWSPSEHVHERGHVMPILTPGYPAMNSTVNVTYTTLRVLKEEFTRGKLILDDMLLKTLSSPAAWTHLFAPSDFSVRYDHYLQVRLDAHVNQPEEALLHHSSFVASRLRRLVVTLQHTAHILTVHPFPTLVEHENGGSFFLGFEVDPLCRDAGAVVAPVLKYFLATEMSRTEGLTHIMYIPWQQLPSCVFPLGKDNAASDRAKYMLSRAHNLHMAIRPTPLQHYYR